MSDNPPKRPSTLGPRPPSRAEIAASKPELIAEFHKLVRENDLAGYKRFLGRNAAHVPREVKDQLIEEFKRYAAAWREMQREV